MIKEILFNFAVVKGVPKMIDVHFLQKVNFSTIAQSVLATLREMSIDPENVVSCVSDNAEYMKKSWRDVLKILLPNALPVYCLCHVLNLVGEVWSRGPYLQLAQTFVTMFKSCFHIHKGARKRRYLQYLREKNMPPKLCPLPCSTRWNTWFEAVNYHAEHLHVYEGFFKGEGSSVSVGRVLQILREQFDDLEIELLFVQATCGKVSQTLDVLQESSSPMALRASELLSDVGAYLQNGCSRILFSQELDDKMDDMPLEIKKKWLDKFHDIFLAGLSKFSKHYDQLPAAAAYKQCRIFDPQCALSMKDDLASYSALKLSVVTNGDQVRENQLEDEWRAYHNEIRHDKDLIRADPIAFWKSHEERWPLLAKLAEWYLWLPVSSCDAERSFSLYKHMLSDRRQGLLHSNLKHLAIMNFNKLSLTDQKEMGEQQPNAVVAMALVE